MSAQSSSITSERLTTSHSRGRVRSGCLTCRKRHVKCDEHRPNCRNCDRLSRVCVYKDTVSHGTGTYEARDSTSTDSQDVTSLRADDVQSTTDPANVPAFNVQDLINQSHLDYPTRTTPREVNDGDEDSLGNIGLLPPQNDSNTVFPDFMDDFNPGSGFRGIEMSYEFQVSDHTIPIMPLTERPLFPYFLQHVEPPFIYPCDGVNWSRMRRYIAALGSHISVIAAAIQCVEALYEAETNSNDTTNATALYYAAKISHAKMLEDEHQGLETTLVVTFLLCCFEIVAQQDTVSITMKAEGAFVRKLETWVQHRPWPPVVCRLEIWLKILHGKALHLGGRGLLSAKVNQLLSTPNTNPTPSLSILDQNIEPESIIYDSLSSPLFEFYVQTQNIGTQICGLNRHHRSRGSPTDEVEVDLAAQQIRKDLYTLWQQRPSLLRLSHSHLRDQLSNSLIDGLSMLIDICNAAYFIEIVDVGRAHGPEWLSATPEAQEAMRQVRHIVDNNSDAHGGLVNTGFIWPIFMYALEADDEGGTWAVNTLRQIKNPVCRSELIADLTEGVLAEQRKKVQRVDCRYFCIEKLGVHPPFI